MIRGRTIIIAEAGVNHNGRMDLAKELIVKAKQAGADYVKFQTFKANQLVSPDAKKAAYQELNAPESGKSQLEMLQALELSEDEFTTLYNFAKEERIGFLSTPFDHQSADFLNTLGMDYFKIGSGDLTNGPLLAKVARYKRPVILSTGMANLPEIREAVDVLIHAGLSKDQLTILQCNTEYPTPPEDVNLNAMRTIQEALGTAVGYSDHAVGVEYAVAAVAMGAKVIEKHLTLDRQLEGPDHAASSDPQEFAQMVSMIRNIEFALGTGDKVPSTSEQKNLSIARKSIHIAQSIKGGEVLTDQHLVMKRPGTGISPMRWPEVVGRSVKYDLEANHLLKEQDLN